ncbi:hypothetical protein PSP6_80165 [Paraburkholderia tropica]|nr:hypothetical protein PSP6_80165 [Paraburkholderia tropica]
MGPRANSAANVPHPSDKIARLDDAPQGLVHEFF